MTKMVTTKNLYNEASVTTASTTYGAPNWRSFWRYDSGNWDGTIEVYFEAVLSHSGGTAYAALYTAAGAVVTGSEVSTTATSETRVRSGNIFSNISTNDYTVRIKASGATATLYNARIIIKQSGIITKKEYYIPITGGGFGTTSTTLADQPRTSIIVFDPRQWDGTYSVYFEMCASCTNGIDFGAAVLRDTTASATISTITTTSTTTVRVRSAALTMNSGAAEYRCQYRSNNSLNTFNLADAYLVVIQSGSPTKGVFHSAFKNMNLATISTSAVLMPGSWFYWDDDDWDVHALTVTFEVTFLISNAASLALVQGAQAVGGPSAVGVTTASTTKVRSFDSFIAPEPNDNEEYVAYIATTSASHTATMYAPRFVSYVDFSKFTPKIIMV